MELTEFRVCSEVESVVNRDKRECGFSCSQAECVIAQRSEREFVHTISGKAVCHFLLDIGNVKRGGVYVVFLAIRYK